MTEKPKLKLKERKFKKALEWVFRKFDFSDPKWDDNYETTS